MILTKVEINGIDVTSYLVNYELEKVYGDAINECELKFVRGINDVVSLDTGQTVEIWRGFITSTDKKIFNGYIEKFQPETGLFKITAKDKIWDLVRKEVTHTYDSTIDASAGKISEIFKDLVNTYGLLTADATSVQDSGTTILLAKFVCNHTDIFERCKALATALDWQFYYRADTDKVYFEPKGFPSNANTLNVGTNVISLPQWNYDNTEMVNDLTVVGAFQEIETTENGQIGVTSGYTTTGISINFTPISVKVYMDANNPPTTLLTGGLPDSTTSFDYYVDKNQKKIFPKPTTTFTSNNYAQILYSHAVPIPVHMYIQASIDAYGQFKKTITFNDLRSVSDAETRGANYLVRYGTPFIYTTLKVSPATDLGLEIGQMIQVIDNISPKTINSNLVINRLRMRYPGDYDEVDVGDKYWRLSEWQGTVEERFKRLAEDELSNQDIITELVTTDNTILTPINLQNRYFAVFQQSLAGDTMIWDNDVFGIWDTAKWGSGTITTSFVLGNSLAGILGVNELGSQISAEELFYIAQGGNIYEENFIDTDFEA